MGERFRQTDESRQGRQKRAITGVTIRRRWDTLRVSVAPAGAAGGERLADPPLKWWAIFGSPWRDKERLLCQLTLGRREKSRCFPTWNAVSRRVRVLWLARYIGNVCFIQRTNRLPSDCRSTRILAVPVELRSSGA